MFSDEEYTQMSCIVIQKYLKEKCGILNDLDEIQSNYPLAVKRLTETSKKQDRVKSVQGVKSVTQGARSITFGENEAFDLTSDIISLLPSPIGFRAW